MITDQFDSRFIVMVHAGTVIVSSAMATVRIDIGHRTDDDTCAWLTEQPMAVVLDHVTPKAERTFDSEWWLAWCERERVDTADAYELRDLALEDGEHAWAAHVNGTQLTNAQREEARARVHEFWRHADELVATVVAVCAWAQARKPEVPLTIEQVAHDCWRAQDACNLSGLVLSWARWMPTINAHAREKGLPANGHEINVVMIDKLRQLAGIEELHNNHINQSYSVVHRLAGEPT